MIKLNEIDFTDANERHVFGDIYEQILKDLQSAGNAWILLPSSLSNSLYSWSFRSSKLGESILDPASGTGGFLLVRLIT